MKESEKQLEPKKKLTSTLQSAIAETLYNRDDRLDIWVQHFSLLHSKQNTFTDDAFKNMESLPTMDDLGSEPTIEELSKAITETASWETPGSEGIPALVPSMQVLFITYMTF